MWDAVVRFLDIGGISGHHCLNFLVITTKRHIINDILLSGVKHQYHNLTIISLCNELFLNVSWKVPSGLTKKSNSRFKWTSRSTKTKTKTVNKTMRTNINSLFPLEVCLPWNPIEKITKFLIYDTRKRTWLCRNDHTCSWKKVSKVMQLFMLLSLFCEGRTTKVISFLKKNQY